MTAAVVRAAFATQAQWCRRLEAPFTAMLCEAVGAALDPSTATGAAVLAWTGDAVADAVALRIAGGLHALVRAGALPGLAALYPPAPQPDAAALASAVAAALRDADAAVLPWLASAPQTNEVARSAVLMAGLLVVADQDRRPLALLELGCSAGLNLRLDSYRLGLGGVDVGPPDAPLALTPVWTGPPPPAAAVAIAARRGVDLSPIDVCDPLQRARLLAYVWPDQPERIARMQAAVDAAGKDPPPIDRGDAADWIETQLARAPPPGTARVVMHSIAFQYFPPAVQQRVAAAIARAGTRSDPLYWLSYEFEAADGAPAVLRLRRFPGGPDRVLATAHPHGAHVKWLG